MIIPSSDDRGHGEEVVLKPRTTTLSTEHPLATFCQQVGEMTFEQEEEKKEKDGGVCLVLATEKRNLPGETFAKIGDGNDDNEDNDNVNGNDDEDENDTDDNDNDDNGNDNDNDDEQRDEQRRVTMMITMTKEDDNDYYNDKEEDDNDDNARCGFCTTPYTVIAKAESSLQDIRSRNIDPSIFR